MFDILLAIFVLTTPVWTVVLVITIIKYQESRSHKPVVVIRDIDNVPRMVISRIEGGF